MKAIDLTPDVSMPIIGIGTWEVKDESILRQTIDAGFLAGCRFIDSAVSYGNEAIIGRILPELLAKHDLTRQDIFITSKLTTSCQGKVKARECALKSVENFGFDYLDLYIIHFPGCSGLDPSDPKNKQLRMESWLELEKLKVEGKFRAIGVSNYMVPHLEHLKTYADEMPSVNQCEFHPHQVQKETRQWCLQNGVHFQAYSSLGTKHNKENLFTEPVIMQMAQKHRCSIPQLLLAWAICQGVSVLPKSYNPEHVADNMQATEIKLDPDDIEEIAALDKDVHYCWDPNSVT